MFCSGSFFNGRFNDLTRLAVIRDKFAPVSSTAVVNFLIIQAGHVKRSKLNDGLLSTITVFNFFSGTLLYTGHLINVRFLLAL